MSTSRIILASLPSFCQKLSKLVEISKVLTKTILHSFFRHGVQTVTLYRVAQKTSRTLRNVTACILYGEKFLFAQL